MDSMSIDPATAAIGAQFVEGAARALSAATAALPTLTMLFPAGADAVSAQAAAAFATEAADMLALSTAAQEEIARAGTALTNIARMYTEIDGAAAATLMASGEEVSGPVFAGPTGAAGMLRAEMLPGAAGTAARTPLMARLIEGATTSAPAATATPAAASPAFTLGAAAAATGASAAMPSATSPAAALGSAAAGAASTVVSAASAPLSSLSSLASGASAGGAAGPALASSLTETEDDAEGEQPAAERLV